MNRRPLNYILTIVFGGAMAFGCAQEDSASLDQSEVFVKYYGTDRAEVLIDMVRTPGDNPSTPDINEGGFILLASTSDTQDGSRDFLLVGTDFGGNRIWQYQYDFFTGDDVPSNLRLSNDSTTVFITGTANINSDNEALLFVQADINSGQPLSMLRTQYYDERLSEPAGAEVIDSVRTRGADVVELDDAYVFLGSAQTGTQFHADVNNYNIFYFSIPKQAYDTTVAWVNLDVIWDELDGLNTGNDFGIKLAEDNDEYFYLGQSQEFSAGNQSRVRLAQIDVGIGGGREGDQPLFGVEGVNSFPANFIIYNQNLVVTGTAGSNLNEKAFFLSVNRSLTDSDEDMLLVGTDTATVEGPLEGLEGSRGQDIVRLSNGDYYIIGQFNNFTNEDGVLKQNEIALIRVDDLGNVIPSGIKVLGSDGNDQGNAILLDGAQEDVVIGATMDFGGVATMLALMKTNVDGDLEE